MGCQFCGSYLDINARGHCFIFCEKDKKRYDTYYHKGRIYQGDHIYISARSCSFTFFYKNKTYLLFHDKYVMIIFNIQPQNILEEIHEDLSNNFIPFDFKNIEDENINSYITNYKSILVRVVNLLCFK